MSVLELLRWEVARRYTTTVRRALEAAQDGESRETIVRELRDAAYSFDREPGFGKLAAYLRALAVKVSACE